MGFGGLLSSNMVSCFRRTRIPFLWALFFPLKLWVLSQKAEISVAKAGEDWRSLEQQGGDISFSSTGSWNSWEISTEGKHFLLEQDLIGLRLQGVPSWKSDIATECKMVGESEAYNCPNSGCDFTDLWPSDFCGEVFWHQMWYFT